MFEDAVPLDGKIYVENCEWGHVWTIEGCHLGTASFCGTIASKDLVVKVDYNLGYL